jgi:hypothetical protein
VGSSSARAVPKAKVAVAAKCAARTGPQLTLESSDAALRPALNGMARRWALSGAAADHRAASSAVAAEKLEQSAPLAEAGLGSRVVAARAVAVGQEAAGHIAASALDADRHSH